MHSNTVSLLLYEIGHQQYTIHAIQVHVASIRFVEIRPMLQYVNAFQATLGILLVLVVIQNVLYLAIVNEQNHVLIINALIHAPMFVAMELLAAQ